MQDTPGPHYAPTAAAPAIENAVAFAGDNGDFRRLVTRGALLELVTAGFYRFWLATNIRRHLWSNTVLGDDALEYLGTGRELLIGFLFALAILAPVYLVYFLIGIEAERYRAFASVPLGLFFVGFSQFALYRARRYRLHRTSWRGLRFGMEGSGLAYAARAMAWGLATALSLGLALPWAQAALERYKMSHTFYGDLPGCFDGRGWDLFKRVWWIWAAAIGGYLGLVAISVLARPSKLEFKDAGAGGLLLALLWVASAFAWPSLYAAYKAIQWKWWLEGLRVGEARASSRLTAGSLIGNYWAMIGWSALFAIAAMATVKIIASVANATGLGPHALNPVFLGVGAVYIAMALAYGVVFRIYLYQRVWKIVVSSLTIHDLETAQNVSMRPARTPSALGEGFADSLDVVGF